MNTTLCNAKMIRPDRHRLRACVERSGMTYKSVYVLCMAALMMGGTANVGAQAAGSGAPTETGSSPASEEGTGLIVSLAKAGGEDFNDQERLRTPIGLRACSEGSVEVSISGIPSSPEFPYLEVWHDTGMGSCNQGDRATRESAAYNCTRLTTDRDGQQIVGATVLNTRVQIAPVCALNADQTTGVRQGPQTFWFLLLPSEGSTEDAVFYRAFTINIDTLAPEVPTNVNASSSQTDIRVTWDSSPGVTNYWVAADYSGGAVGADAGPVADGCTSSYLRAGERFDPDAQAPGLLIRKIDAVSTEMSFAASDFEGVEKVPVVVAAQDLAGNISVMSEVSCITVTHDWCR